MQGKQLGFDGKTLIHPSTIDKCNEIFSPRKEEVERAQKIIQAWDTAIEEGSSIPLNQTLLNYISNVSFS